MKWVAATLIVAWILFLAKALMLEGWFLLAFVGWGTSIAVVVFFSVEIVEDLLNV